MEVFLTGVYSPDGDYSPAGAGFALPGGRYFFLKRSNQENPASSGLAFGFLRRRILPTGPSTFAVPAQGRLNRPSLAGCPCQYPAPQQATGAPGLRPIT